MTRADSPDPRRSWTRLDGVDILRGLAIFFVLMNHVNMRLRGADVPYAAGLPDQLVSALVWNGQRGVQMFFAISGFLITATSIRRWGALSKVSVRDFYRLRFARIAPLLAALLAILSLLHFVHLKNFVVGAKAGGLSRALLAALTFRINVLEAKRGYLPGNWDILWSLSVEEVFYLLFPLICIAAGRSKLLVAILLAFLWMGPFGRTLLSRGDPVWQEYSYIGGMDAIALGCLTALFVSRTTIPRTAVQLFAGMGSALLIFTVCFSHSSASLFLHRYGLDMTVVGFGTSMVVAAAAQTRWSGPCVSKPLLRLGQRSYEVYLTHMFVVFACFELFVRLGKPLAAVPALFVCVILVAGLTGEAVARFYSEPMNHLLRNRWGDGPDTLGSAVQMNKQAPVRRR